MNIYHHRIAALASAGVLMIAATHCGTDDTSNEGGGAGGQGGSAGASSGGGAGADAGATGGKAGHGDGGAGGKTGTGGGSSGHGNGGSQNGGSSQGGSAGLSGTTSYSPPAYLPDHTDGIPTTAQWIHGATLIVKDVVGGDLVGFFRGTNSLHAAVSADDGQSWSWVDPASNVDIDPTLAIAQGADGSVHIISWSWALGASYSRVTLLRDGANHINGFSSAATRIAFPSSPDAGDMSADIVAGADQAGNPVLLYAIYDNYSADGGRVVAGKTSSAAGQSPNASSDFVGLDDTAGASQLDVMTGDGWASPHNACVLIGQHPGSKDLWLQWGPLNTGDGITQNTLPLKRLRATASGTTFAPQGVQVVASHNGSYGVQNYAVTSTPNSVWFAYGTPDSAVIIDRVGADGVVVPQAIPSPYDGKNSGGFYTLAVNAAETDIWLAGQIGWDTSDPNVTPEQTWAKHWNGSNWTTYDAEVITDERFRLARSAGWDNGLVFVQSRFDYDSWRPAVGTLRTLP